MNVINYPLVTELLAPKPALWANKQNFFSCSRRYPTDRPHRLTRGTIIVMADKVRLLSLFLYARLDKWLNDDDEPNSVTSQVNVRSALHHMCRTHVINEIHHDGPFHQLPLTAYLSATGIKYHPWLITCKYVEWIGNICCSAWSWLSWCVGAILMLDKTDENCCEYWHV